MHPLSAPASAGSSPDLRDLDRRAVRASIEIVRDVVPPALDRATPCAGWTLRELLQHMAAQHRGFAAAARGHGGEIENWAVRPTADPVGDYVDSSQDVLAAFSADGVLVRQFVLAEFDAEATFPAELAIGFHFIDYVVHTWDVARSIERTWEPDHDLLGPALAIAMAVPNGAERTAAGAAFAPSFDLDEQQATFDRILRVLGRSPSWPDGAPSALG